MNNSNNNQIVLGKSIGNNGEILWMNKIHLRNILRSGYYTQSSLQLIESCKERLEARLKIQVWDQISDPLWRELYNEQEQLEINFNTEEISPANITNYIILQYFKGTRYKKSFSGLTSDYLSPIIITVNINPIIIYEKYQIGDYVFSDNNVGMVINVSDDYQQITIQPYSTIFEETDAYYIIINKNALIYNFC